MLRTENIRTHAFRLSQGKDLKKSIEEAVKVNEIRAGWIMTCVGSLTDYNIRFANQSEGTPGRGHFEILGLTGTVGVSGLHLHISLGDGKGKTLGGHLLEGCLIYTTAELILASTDSYTFERETDPATGCKELRVVPLSLKA